MNEIELESLAAKLESHALAYEMLGEKQLPALLREAASALTQPEGFVLVPVEPTPKMVDATWAHCIDRDGGIESQNSRNKRIYTAMLSARPEIPND